MTPPNDAAVFDALLQSGNEAPSPCPVCTGEGGDPCTEECAELVARADRLQSVKGLYRACYMAMLLARRYRTAEGMCGERERDALRQIRVYRDKVRALRTLDSQVAA